MKCSDAGLDLIKTHEGLRLEAYPDPGTGGAPWTIGYGHTGSNVYEGLHIDDARADEFLRQDIETAERCVNNSVKVPLTQGQFDALCSFVFNLGCGALGKSTLLAKLNAGVDDGEVAQEFARWNKAAGKVLQGLVVRRRAEADMFLA